MVFEDGQKLTVLKHTLSGFFGRIMDEAALLDPRTFLSRRKLTMRGALPSEYLRRWAVLHDIFGLPTMYEGITSTHLSEPQMAVAQPYIEQDDADPAELGDVIQFMEAHGFAKVDPARIAIPEVADVTWYRQRDGILITDAHARNFRKETTTGALVPVDLVVSLIPPGITQTLSEPLSAWQPREEE